MESYRPTWAEIDLKAIRHNFNVIKSMVKKDVKIMAVVKANAYGHGSVEVSRVLESEQADYLGVATLDEAVTLREAGVKAPILILGSIFPHEAITAAQNDITLTLCNAELLKAIVDNNLPVKVHIKIDTGMGRIGVWHEDAVPFIASVRDASDKITIEGIYTHFSIAGRDKFFTTYQIDSFIAVCEKAKEMGIDIPLKHASNSLAIIDWERSHFNMVRPGLIIFGMAPRRPNAKVKSLKPVLALKTKVAFVKNVGPGRSVSYGRTFIAQTPTCIATLPIGYADGYGRILSGKAQVLINGSIAPVVGKVTMDQTMIDVGLIGPVNVGDEVVLVGKQKNNEIKVETLGRLSGTIPYEIVVGITSRVPRLYLS